MAGVPWKCVKNPKKLLNNVATSIKSVSVLKSTWHPQELNKSLLSHSSLPLSVRNYVVASYPEHQRISSNHMFMVSRLLHQSSCEFLAPPLCGVTTIPNFNPSHNVHLKERLQSRLFLPSAKPYSDQKNIQNLHQGADGGKGASPPDEDEEAKRKERESYWRTMKLSFIFLGATFGITTGYLIYELGPQKRDENGNIIEDEFSHLPPVKQLFSRISAELQSYNRMLKKPSRDKLLPDPVEPPYHQPPYTLILELTDLLVHPDWTYQTGWRFKKRPHVDSFLEQIGPPLFEIVIYTAEQGLTVFPIIDSLDPKQLISYRLVRDATDFIDGHHVKNLDCLNRDLSKVIVVDWNSESVKLHPNNVFLLPRWKGHDSDHSLLDLAAFLKTIAMNQVEDVREVLQYYRQFDDPLEAFKENQRKFLEQLEEKQKLEEERKKNKPLAAKWSSSLFSFGPKI